MSLTIPPALAQYRQFILYGPDKKPRSPHTGQVSDPHDPTQWVDGLTALIAAERFGLAPGFVFTANDNLVFLDIDHALQPDGTWSPIAVALCQQYAGAYVEVSTSGTGLHIIGATAPLDHPCRNRTYSLEL